MKLTSGIRKEIGVVETACIELLNYLKAVKGMDNVTCGTSTVLATHGREIIEAGKAIEEEWRKCEVEYILATRTGSEE